MRERRREYELMFIISPLHASEESVNAVIDRVRQAVVAVGGEVASVDHSPPWGRRKLAYPIREYAGGEASRRNFTEGFYVLMLLNLSSTKVIDLERTLKLTDPILRHLITVAERKPQRPAPVLVDDTAAETFDSEESVEDEDSE